MASEKQIEKFVENEKVLKLIDRIYRGERIDEDQFLIIYNFVQKKGKKTYRIEKWNCPIYNLETNILIRTDVETKLTEGKMYLGVFAYKTSDDNNLVFCDVRPDGGKMTRISHNKKVSPHLFWMGW